MKLLITGASGYLGAAILHEALAEGYRIRVLLRPESDRSQIPDEVEIIQGNLLDSHSLHQAMKGCGAVIHSAGLVSIWRRNPNDFYQTNVLGTVNILRAARDEKVARVVYTSSFFALGPTRERPADETWSNHLTLPPTEYARSKTEADKRVMNWVEEGNNAVLLYPVFLYGPGKSEKGNCVSTLLEDYINRRIPGVIYGGNKRWTYSYLQDVARGHILALEKGRTGEKYILGGEDATLRELFDIVKDITGVERSRGRRTSRFLNQYAWLEETKARFFKQYTPKMTRESLGVYRHHWRYSSQKAIGELGYIRTPLKVGIIKTLESLGLAPKEDRSTIL